MKKILLAIGMILRFIPAMGALEMPEPEIPAAGAVIYAPHPHFRWKREADVKIDEIHSIQIARDAAFGDLACDDRLEVVSRFVPVKPLAPGKYWWRVRRGEMEWSAPTPFEVRVPKNVVTVPLGSDAAAVARLIKEAAAHTPALVKFEPGEYKLTPEEGKSIVTLDKVSDLIVDGQGSQLVLGGTLLRLNDCRRVTIQNFTVTPNRPGHTQVRILSKDVANGRLVVKPEPGYDPDVEHYFGNKNAGSFLACMDPDPVRHGKNILGAMISAHSKNPPRVTPAPDQPGAFVFSPVDAATLERCPVGGPAIITAYRWHWVVFQGGEECTFSHVTVSGLPGAFSSGGGSAKSMLACKVKLRAPQDYFGGHSACGSGRIGEWIQNCEFECLPDDGPAEQSFRMLVKGADGTHSVLVAGHLANSPFCVGGRVALVNPKDSRGAAATVTNVTQEAKGLRVQMDRPLSELAAAIGRNAAEDWKGVFIYVDTPSNEDFVYRNNRHVGGRGHGVKFNGTRAWIADSYFENLNGNAVESGYPSELSGHGASDVVISGNTIVRCGWTPIYSASKSGLGENLIIRNNQINEVREMAIGVKGYKHVTITGNQFTSSTQPKAKAWVVCEASSNVLCKSNKFPAGLPEIKPSTVSAGSPEIKTEKATPKLLVPISAVTDSLNQPVLGRIENEALRVEFISATRAGKTSARPVVSVKTASGWKMAPLDPSAESYQVLSAAGDEVRFEIAGFHPRWTRTAPGASKGVSAIWKVGEGCEAIVRKVSPLDKNRLKLSFYPTPGGCLEAIWELQPVEKTIRVALEFTPSVDGQVSLGYFLFNRKPLEQVDSLLMPMLVQAKRFPSKDYTILQTQAPTPVSLMQTGKGNDALTWGVSGDPASTPFEFPIPAKPRYGLHIRSPQESVQPSIYGPLLGTPDAQAKVGKPVKFTFRVLVQSGDWYAAYRTIADKVFGWRDYRSNVAVSLTGAALNMLDLYMDDNYGGWWERAKAPYQVESKNGSTQSSPMTAVSLYRLTGDPEVYHRRALPTLEFLLSRSGPHFSPIPEDTGGYAKGSMKGPVNIYGSTTYAGIWEIMNRRTPAFREIALPGDGIRQTTTQQNFQTHNQPFDEWLGRYLFTGEKAALERAITEADEYIKTHIETPPCDEPGINPFFLMAYTPAWEGLLRMYEVTKEKRFLDAAAAGARIVMTGMWTQPTPAIGDVTIHPGGYLHGDKLTHLLYKGAEVFRLGWPRPDGDTPEKKVPGWLVSNVGLGFEQPTTYTYKDNGGRMILQAPWAPAFLRLAQYTGDAQFETYARNAVLGRWSNYPGYYYTAFSDLAQNTRYPYTGPDMGFFYYHHIIVHLSWVLDYLVSEASMRSNGGIQFPALRQFGYAYFDNLIYGHAPGEIMGQKDAWLWLRKDLVALDNPQINYLTAHTRDKFFVILMNESKKPETVCVTFKPSQISKGARTFERARKISGKESEMLLKENAGKVTLDPRGLAVIEVDGLEIDVPAHQLHPEPKSWVHPGFLKTPAGDGNELCAAAIQIEPGPWNAFVWSTAASGSLRELSLQWKIGNQTGTLKDVDYPYEFSMQVPAGQTHFSYSVSGIKADGTPFMSEEMTIGVGR